MFDVKCVMKMKLPARTPSTAGNPGFSSSSQILCGIFSLVAGLILSLAGPIPVVAESAPVVHLYCAQDQVFAEPILAEFHQSTGIRVLPVFDSEAVKTVGLANRLLAERRHPVGDVFWGNEEFRCRQLAAAGVFRETNSWIAFGHRSRRMVINPQRLATAAAPQSLVELTNQAWRGKISFAFPGFGTTATHFMALRQAWGEARWLQWCRALAANRPFIEEGNSQVVRRVARGEAWVGLTDSDDIAAGRREGWSVAALPAGPEMLMLPNTVGVVRECPHPEAAEALFNFLSRPGVQERLIAADALEAGAVFGPSLQPNWPALLVDLDRATVQIRKLFRP